MARKQQRVFAADASSVAGRFTDIDGERFYVIENVDKMPAFFISLVSHANHWLFISSNGALTAGRVSPDTALFPYVTVDKIHDSACHTGCKTLFRVQHRGTTVIWEPFGDLRHGTANITRNLYKNTLGNKLRFEETHHELQLTYRYTWAFSDAHGFIRQCELRNQSSQPIAATLIDGFQNILPAGAPRFAQTNTSNLVDAYKWTELDESSGTALFALYSGITDRAEPCESLRANTVYCQGLAAPKYLLTTTQLGAFVGGDPITTETHTRGTRGCYFVNADLTLAAGASQHWHFVADIEKDQAQITALIDAVNTGSVCTRNIAKDIAKGAQQLQTIMATCDSEQVTSEPHVTVHHYANVLFNVLRGGVFDDHYTVQIGDFARSLRCFDRHMAKSHADWLAGLPQRLTINELLTATESCPDPQLQRLAQEYLPIRFGRRHGDPSRPWNQFAIELSDDAGKRTLAYQGNWRDIFQNWEALAFSYPEFIENMIAKFVNASTMDGFNPYRITDEGIDWEVEEPDDPWSYIGYWGDHQIIYLQKLLEMSEKFHPLRLQTMLQSPRYAYANVPYRIRPFDALYSDGKNTVDFDDQLAHLIEQRVNERGADGKLVLDDAGNVRLVTLLEKLLVPLLSKLGNLVLDGGIWLNTQRPEWNDANNALVGQGLSMVTLYYLRRYVVFFGELAATLPETIALSPEVGEWLVATQLALREQRTELHDIPVAPDQRLQALQALGRAASDYRDKVYARSAVSDAVSVPTADLTALLDHALHATDHCIAVNRRDDGMYHAYNTMRTDPDGVQVSSLYPMLEGQVAALSSGALSAQAATEVLDALFASSIYRDDQQSFMLYPDRALPSFLARNQVPADALLSIPLASAMRDAGDERIFKQDPQGIYRFNARLTNASALDIALGEATGQYGDLVTQSRDALHALYEKVFDHQAFTGRSGTMFGFEGLGCIYWHMVSKLLLAVQEVFLNAEASAPAEVTRKLARYYYQVRAGLSFNKSPQQYGAFPTDPYSHTPGHAGAQQPGMTGQVKEEILTRFGELGIRVAQGCVTFSFSLLRRQEFVATPGRFDYIDLSGEHRHVELPGHALAFTWCQVPFVYELVEGNNELVVSYADGEQWRCAEHAIPADICSALVSRSGTIDSVRIRLQPSLLFAE
ncbi:MAG: hypothetical protein AAFO81_05190 [Pseudomonadota bacterium]